MITARHELTTIDMIGRALNIFECALIANSMQQDLLVRACTCGYICIGATMNDVKHSHQDHLAV